MAFKMKNPSVMKMAKEAGAAMRMKSPMKKDKDKHDGGVIGGKQKKGEIVTDQKDVAMRRINAMDITPEKTKGQWEHLANKANWRITQLPNGYYQTEVNHPNDADKWSDVTRRETLEGAEKAIDGSIEHFTKKLEATKGPKVVKTFEK